MRKLFFILLFSCLLFAQYCHAECCFPPHHFDVYVPKFKGGLKFDLGVLYLRPTLPELDFAFTLQGGDFRYNNISPAYGDWSYEAGVGYDFPCTGNDIHLSYSKISQDDSGLKESGNFLVSTTAVTPVFITDTVSVSSMGIPLPSATATGFLIDPTQVGFIRQIIFFKQDRLDFELGQSLHMTPDFRLRIFAGLCGAVLDNKFTTTSALNTRDDRRVNLVGRASDPSSPTLSVPFIETVDFRQVTLDFNDQVIQKSDFSGAGPRVGLDANYYLDIGISLFARLSTALIVGETQSSVAQLTQTLFTARVGDVTITPSDPSLVLTPSLTPGDAINEDITQSKYAESENDTRIVPNLEARIGITYTPCLPFTCSRVFIEGGYMVNHYFNAVDKLTNDPLTASTSNSTHLDLTYDGVYLKFEMHV